jgi:outer membrane protein OmpA-like peptidoglycan-associated protein
LFSRIGYSQTDNQIDKDISSEKMKDRAVHAAKTGDVYTALFYYEEIVKRDSSNLDALYQLGEMHRFSRNYKKALQVYSNVFGKAPTKYPFALYYKGLMQKMLGDYDQAKKNMNQFKKEAGKIADKTFATLMAKEIAGCDSGMVYQEFPDNVKIENIGSSVNYPHIEFSPFLLDSANMLFGSLRMDSLVFFDKADGQYEKMPVRQIYQAQKSDGKWEETGKFDVLNDPTADMGNFVYSSYSNKYYFSKCFKDVKGHVTCKIYSTEKSSDGKWTSPVALPDPINIEGFSSTQPAIVIDTNIISGKPDIKKKPAPSKNIKNTKSPKNTTTTTTKGTAPKVITTEYLYFVSDRPEGKGGQDIWFTSYNSARKVWSKPVNFALANTVGSDVTPFYHVPSQTFYFSSDGYPTAGGLDIFKMKRNDKRFSRPSNMSFPINSPQDDLGFTLGPDSTKGLLVSNRPGGTPYFHETCCDDIYSFTIMAVKPFVCNLSLALVDPDTSGCFRNQSMNLISYSSNGKNKTTQNINVPDCKYEMPLKKGWTYKFSITRPGYNIDTLTIETREMCATEIIEKKFLMNKKKPEIAIINETPEEGKTFVLKDIQYETNQSELSTDAKAALDSVLVPFLKKYPKDKLIISSHTDDQGSHKYNHRLSQLRAEGVVTYLISKGIVRDRLQAKGFGETKPIMPNQNPDGTDNPIGRALNRRTEFLLVKEGEKINP